MEAWTRLRLITIDLDDTVWPCAPVIREAEAAHYAWLAAQAPRLTAAHDTESLRSHRRELMRQQPEIAHDVTALRRTALQQLLVAHRYPAELADGAMEVFRRARNCVEPYADVIPALHRLRRHCQLVSITNGNAEVQETPLRDRFDRCLTAAEAGAAKPAPALFEQAMAWAEATPAESLHVGDDPFLDVEAARAIGIATVWVNRHARPWPAELEPPLVEVADLHALEAWLDLPVVDE
ncbi:MAG: HAD-IA family hydrolase [Gammaproteobacteria bacterium]|jgi:putative hydrolase of the HAD superfamily|nr:HAD-IA family hydrolase [Gammaproteobacteria bacterium]